MIRFGRRISHISKVIAKSCQSLSHNLCFGIQPNYGHAAQLDAKDSIMHDEMVIWPMRMMPFGKCHFSEFVVWVFIKFPLCLYSIKYKKYGRYD